MQKTFQTIDALLSYALERKLIASSDSIYMRNKILAILQLDSYTQELQVAKSLEPMTIAQLLDALFSQEIKERLAIETAQELEQIQTAVMDVFAKRPSEIMQQFMLDYTKNADIALQHFYAYCKDINYIKDDRENVKWLYTSDYGSIEMTINLAKPEKDPKDIAKLLGQQLSSEVAYPQCPLCVENVGFQGTIQHAARQTLRIIPVSLAGESWFLQYSPYGYYPEHAIVLKAEHTDMQISAVTFERLLDFVDQFPNYFIGSNAGLPIVGGSILNHEHFQAGRYEFPMMRAETFWKTKTNHGVEVSLLQWPVSTIKLSTSDRNTLVKELINIATYWHTYTNTALEIFAASEQADSHNAITPIVRFVDGTYEAFIALRNNKTSHTYPDGIFHVHPEIFHIKKENIGLIEVMGLAILPSRLKMEIEEMMAYLQEKAYQEEVIMPHLDWLNSLKQKYQFKALTKHNMQTVIFKEIGAVFTKGLGHTGVFKENSAFILFIEAYFDRKVGN